VICAWCGADLGEAVGCSDDSHGICKACMARELAKLDEEARKHEVASELGQLGGKDGSSREKGERSVSKQECVEVGLALGLLAALTILLSVVLRHV